MQMQVCQKRDYWQIMRVIEPVFYAFLLGYCTKTRVAAVFANESVALLRIVPHHIAKQFSVASIRFSGQLARKSYSQQKTKQECSYV